MDLNKRRKDLSCSIELGIEVVSNLTNCMTGIEFNSANEYLYSLLNDTREVYINKLVPLMEEFNMISAKLDNNLDKLENLEREYEKKLDFKKGEQKNG